MQYYGLTWATHLGPQWAFGANANVATWQTRFHVGDLMLAKSDGESYDIRLGGLFEPAKPWLVGLVFDYGFTPARTTMFPGVKSDDDTHQFLLRPGVSYEYMDGSRAYLDYQFGAFFNDTGCLKVNRFLMGADQKIWKWLFVRAGVALDTVGSAAWTAGVGIYPTNWLSFDIGYQDDLFPEIKTEFGRARVVTISASVTF